jgi:hypothetical protein
VSFQAKQLRLVRQEPEGGTELNNLSPDVCVCYTQTEVTLLGGMFSREGLLDISLHYVTVCI